MSVLINHHYDRTGKRGGRPCIRVCYYCIRRPVILSTGMTPQQIIADFPI